MEWQPALTKLTIAFLLLLPLSAQADQQETLTPGNIETSNNIPAEDTPARNLAYRITNSSTGYYIYKDYTGTFTDIDITTNPEGIDLSLSYFINNNLCLDGGIYQGETSKAKVRYTTKSTLGSSENYFPLSDFTEIKNISNYGVRAGVIYGFNIRDPGFKFYTGLGLYVENITQTMIDSSHISEIIYGTAIKFGLGYNWKHIAIEFWGSIRSGEPKGFKQGSSQGGLALSYRP
jgi:hypothetical protein